MRNEENEKSDVFLQSGTQTLNFCRSFDYARDNESIIYFIDLCKPIERKVHLCYEKSTHLQVSYPAAKH